MKKTKQVSLEQVIVRRLEEAIVTLARMESEEGIHGKEIYAMAQAINYIEGH